MRLNQHAEHATEDNTDPLLEASPRRADNPSSSYSCAQFSTQLSESAASFFGLVSSTGFPKPGEKIQPWRSVWKGPQAPLPDGKLLVACPKRCLYGSDNLGGY